MLVPSMPSIMTASSFDEKRVVNAASDIHVSEDPINVPRVPLTDFDVFPQLIIWLRCGHALCAPVFVRVRVLRHRPQKGTCLVAMDVKHAEALQQLTRLVVSPVELREGHPCTLQLLPRDADRQGRKCRPKGGTLEGSL